MVVVVPETISVTFGAQVYGSDANNRQLGAPPFLNDGQGHGLDVGAAAAFTLRGEGALPSEPTCSADESNDVVAAFTLEVVGFAAVRACKLEGHRGDGINKEEREAEASLSLSVPGGRSAVDSLDANLHDSGRPVVGSEEI